MDGDEGNVHDEIRRTRERLHALEKSTWGLHEGQKTILRRLAVMEPQVSALARKNEIADAVAERLQERGVIRFTRWQIVALCVTMLTAAGGMVLAIVNAAGA